MTTQAQLFADLRALAARPDLMVGLDDFPTPVWHALAQTRSPRLDPLPALALGANALHARLVPPPRLFAELQRLGATLWEPVAAALAPFRLAAEAARQELAAAFKHMAARELDTPRPSHAGAGSGHVRLFVYSSNGDQPVLESQCALTQVVHVTVQARGEQGKHERRGLLQGMVNLDPTLLAHFPLVGQGWWLLRIHDPAMAKQRFPAPVTADPHSGGGLRFGFTTEVPPHDEHCGVPYETNRLELHLFEGFGSE